MSRSTSWTNPVRDGGQDGRRLRLDLPLGRVEVVGSVFSFPSTGLRKLIHEFHTLSLSVLDVSRPGAHTWATRAPRRCSSRRSQGRCNLLAHLAAQLDWPRCGH